MSAQNASVVTHFVKSGNCIHNNYNRYKTVSFQHMFSGIPQLPDVTKCVTTDAFCALVWLGPLTKLNSASELYRPSDRRLSAKLVPTFAGRGCCVVSTTNSDGR
jgi:hypothetical protein